MIRVFFKGADAALLVFDVTREKSFESAERWLQELRDNSSSDLLCYLVGNKIDKKARYVPQEAAKKFCADHGDIPYFEVSAKTRQNIDEAFLQIATLVAKKAEAEYSPSNLV